MWFVKHPRCNHSFGPPQGLTEEQCRTLSVERKVDPQYGMTQTSFWKPNAADLAKLNAGGVIALSIFSAGHPMISMATEDATPETASATGDPA